MKQTLCCPKCGSREIVRVPDHPGRHARTWTLLGKIPVIRYVCCGCGYVENWVESPEELAEIRRVFG